MPRMKKARKLEESLSSFELSARESALRRLLDADGGRLPSAGANLNLHFHSFFSFNAEDWSPSRIAWEARKAGLYAAGLCDFDVLDGQEEFVRVGFRLGLRTLASMETRVFVKEQAGVDITSPGEPGVTYIMGAGFARPLPAGSAQERGLAGYRDRARARNVALVSRINPHVPDIAIDYERDVLALTPAGAPTERHIVRAYINRAKSVFDTAGATAGFWAKLLQKDLEETVELLADAPALEEKVRSKLVKRGGVGYEQPSPDTFPPVDEFIRWVLSAEAIPMVTWLDGTSPGEKDCRALLESMRARGAAAVNIIPDRNWNLSKPDERRVKRENLRAVVETAEAMGFPICIGTEMNRHGLPFVDDLDGEGLKPYKEAFTRGARILVGHMLLARFAGYSYVGPRARAEFPEVRKRNAFFESVGALPPPDEAEAKRLEEMGAAKALEWFRERTK
jgi:hypothetical protein